MKIEGFVSPTTVFHAKPEKPLRSEGNWSGTTRGDKKSSHKSFVLKKNTGMIIYNTCKTWKYGKTSVHVKRKRIKEKSTKTSPGQTLSLMAN